MVKFRKRSCHSQLSLEKSPGSPLTKPLGLMTMTPTDLVILRGLRGESLGESGLGRFYQMVNKDALITFSYRILTRVKSFAFYFRKCLIVLQPITVNGQ